MSGSVSVGGRDVSLPVQVRDASAGTATFLVDAAAAAGLLPEGLQPVRIGRRRTPLTLVMVDYRDNDLGSYHEAAIQLTVTRPGLANQARALGNGLRGRPETWTVAMPVDQEFSLAAGREIWGFPKTLDDVRIEIGASRARCVWRADGELVASFSVPRGTARSMPAPPLTAWTVLDGRLHRTRFQMTADHGRLGFGGAEIELGTHPMAKELSRLGLPRRALVTTWMDDVRASFGAALPA